MKNSADRYFETFKHSSLDTADNHLLIERNYPDEPLSESDEFGMVENYDETPMPESKKTPARTFKLSGPGP
jgi:hypothetical protein